MHGAHVSLRRRAWLAAGCALVVLLAVGACTAQPAGPPHKVTLGYTAWPGWFPWEVAKQQGLFAKHHIDVELRYFDDYTASIKALQAGEIDANSQTLNDTLAAVSSGAKQSVVLVNDNSTGNHKIIARSGIDSIGDLKGKRVAVDEGTVNHYLLLLALQQAGLTGDDIRLVPMPTPQAATTFLTAEVDAVAALPPFTTAALRRMGSRAIATSAEFPGAIPDHLVVGRAMLDGRPDDVQALVDTWFDTMRWIREHRAAAVAVMAARAGVSVADYAGYAAGTTTLTLRQNIDAFTPGTTPEHLNYQAGRIADFMVETGLVKQRPSLDGLLDNRFVAAVPTEDS